MSSSTIRLTKNKDDFYSYHDTKLRWLALALACLYQLGNYYCYDFPSVLESNIEKQFNVSPFQYGLLYSLYSFPNVILPLIGGLLIDYIGIRTGLVVFPLFLIVGQGLCVVGSIQNKYTWLLVGRVIYGLGGENMSVVQSAIVSKWFAGKEIAFALGLNITLSRIGTILNSVVSVRLYDVHQNITLVLIVGWFILIFCWLIGLGLTYLDYLSDKRDKQDKIDNFQVEEASEKISLSDLKEFKLDLWLIVISCMMTYINLFVFQQNCIDFFEIFYHVTSQVPYQLPYYMGAIFTPFMGILIDKIGRRPFFLIISGILILTVDVWYLLMPTCDHQCQLTPYLGQIILGIFYVFYAAVLWPTVPLCVTERTVGTAFGVTNSIQNIGLAVGPLIVGSIINSKSIKAYREMMVFFCGIAVIALINNIILFLYDKYKLNGKLSVNIDDKSKVNPSTDSISEKISMPEYQDQN